MKKRPMKKVSKKISKRTNDLILEFRYLFGIQNYEPHIYIHHHPHPENEHVAAAIEQDDEYQRLNLYLYPSFFSSPLDKQRAYLLHEFCHTLTSRLLFATDELKAGRFITPQDIKRASEEATSKMTTIIENIFLGFEKDAQKAYKKYIDIKKQ